MRPPSHPSSGAGKVIEIFSDEEHEGYEILSDDDDDDDEGDESSDGPLLSLQSVDEQTVNLIIDIICQCTYSVTLGRLWSNVMSHEWRGRLRLDIRIPILNTMFK